jgi:hypothetical protein
LQLLIEAEERRKHDIGEDVEAVVDDEYRAEGRGLKPNDE